MTAVAVAHRQKTNGFDINIIAAGAWLHENGNIDYRKIFEKIIKFNKNVFIEFWAQVMRKYFVLIHSNQLVKPFH